MNAYLNHVKMELLVSSQESMLMSVSVKLVSLFVKTT